MEPLALREEQACEIMGCTADRLAKLRRAKKLKELGRGWYAVADLKECIERLREERDGGNVIHLESVSEEAGTVGVQRGRPKHRPTKELLREITSRSGGKS